MTSESIKKWAVCFSDEIGMGFNQAYVIEGPFKNYRGGSNLLVSEISDWVIEKSGLCDSYEEAVRIATDLNKASIRDINNKIDQLSSDENILQELIAGGSSPNIERIKELLE